MYDLDFNEIADRAGFLSKTPHNDSLDQRIEDTRFVAYNVLAPIIVCVGIIGNLLTIIVLRLPQFRGATYTLFFVLAISDLLSLFFCISMLIHLVEGGTQHYSTAVWYSYCELIFTNGPMSSSTLIIVCITIDRYFSVCLPAHFKVIHTNHYARIGIVLSLLLAVVAWCPSAALKEPRLWRECPTTSFIAPSEGTWWVACMKTETRKSTWYVVYSWLRQTITIFIPVIILIVLNSLIVFKFIMLQRKKKKMLGRELPKESPTSEHRRKENQHLIHLLIAVMISFFITVLPSGIFGAVYDENLSTRFRFELLRALANVLEILNHALNFYLYILCSKPIRDAIANMFRSPKRLGALAISNIKLVIQKNASSAIRGGNDTQMEVTVRGRAEVLQSKSGKSKKAFRNTQFSELASDNESSFNKIVSVDEVPKKKVTKPSKKQSHSDQQDDDNSFLNSQLKNKSPFENVYYRAVMNHSNKPQSGFQTIVHTAEVHSSLSDDDGGLTTEEKGDTVTKVDIVKASEIVILEQEYSGQDKLSLHTKQNGYLANEQGHILQDSETKFQYQKSENTQEDSCVMVKEKGSSNSVSKTEGFVNPAFELDEISVIRKKEKDLPNGDIVRSSSLEEIS